MSLESVTRRVEGAAKRANRDAAGITVVAVSKGRPVEAIEGLYATGHRHFGENRADEMAEKAKRLPSDIVWHFVGQLQSRKARTVRPLADYLHSLDRDSLAKAWLKGLDASPPAYVQVNVGTEPQKGGVAPSEALKAAIKWSGWGLSIIGVMAMPPQVNHPDEVQPHFAELARIGRRISREIPGATGLSMGMTEDFEVAVAEGATCIRVGRAIFDASNPRFERG